MNFKFIRANLMVDILLRLTADFQMMPNLMNVSAFLFYRYHNGVPNITKDGSLTNE